MHVPGAHLRSTESEMALACTMMMARAGHSCAGWMYRRSLGNERGQLEDCDGAGPEQPDMQDNSNPEAPQCAGAVGAMIAELIENRNEALARALLEEELKPRQIPHHDLRDPAKGTACRMVPPAVLAKFAEAPDMLHWRCASCATYMELQVCYTWDVWLTFYIGAAQAFW
ncbi:hypothetical protein AK812_SmicGene44170 [Symbiodinium microadriaticum]|uniref:Uncharacterized protein n=1 Tax=Symbiodinium microadriaticum TaxID=2951 RepID=A0A1Q9BZD0_SYMMI|nr:hypothetical protein AK812_SmicGene44170 [Symbiodinium microadriaticum]